MSAPFTIHHNDHCRTHPSGHPYALKVASRGPRKGPLSGHRRHRGSPPKGHVLADRVREPLLDAARSAHRHRPRPVGHGRDGPQGHARPSGHDRQAGRAGKTIAWSTTAAEPQSSPPSSPTPRAAPRQQTTKNQQQHPLANRRMTTTASLIEEIIERRAERIASRPRRAPRAPFGEDDFKMVKVSYDRRIRPNWSEPGKDGLNLSTRVGRPPLPPRASRRARLALHSPYRGQRRPRRR